MSKNSSSILFSEVAKAVDVLGEEGTANVLKKATKSVSANQHIEFVLSMVCERFSLKEDEIVQRTKKQKIIIALHFYCYYAYVVGKVKESKIKYVDIGVRIKRSDEIVRKYYYAMLIKKKDKTDSYHQGHFKAFDGILKNYTKN